MCMRKCGISWSLRRLLLKSMFRYNEDAKLTQWLWEETPFPADMPSWKQLFAKLKEKLNEWRSNDRKT
jgi:hypothetical protein